MRTKPANGPVSAPPPETAELLDEISDLQAVVASLRAQLVLVESRDVAEVTEERLRRTEEEARQMRERLAHVARVSTLGEMATGIAHEINQPLAAVATYAQACGRMIRARTADDVQLLEILDRISRESLRAGAIINKLKDLVRRRDSQETSCDLNSLVRDVAELASVDAHHNSVDLRLSLGDGLPRVLVDPVQIQQVILNLLRNGIESMEGCTTDRTLWLRTGLDEDGWVECSVVDTGHGIGAETEDTLFAPFYTTKKSGMGMGLSISRTIVRAHGGKLQFSRNPSRGATFRFSLPSDESEDTDD